MLEAQRISLLYKLNGLSDEQLSFTIAPNSWSIKEIIEHLVLSEELSVSNALNKIKNPKKLKPVSKKDKIFSLIMNFLLAFPLKFKAPNATISKKKIDYLDLVSRWEKCRKDLELLSTQAPDVLEKGLMKHSKAGYLNLNQMLNFFSAHYSHHLRQINVLFEHKDMAVNNL